MGAQVQNYCDGCGADVGDARVGVDVLQGLMVGTNGAPVQLLWCLNREPVEADEENPMVDQFGRPRQGKIQGCARKLLTKSVLTKLYDEVAEYTGDDSKPFAL